MLISGRIDDVLLGSTSISHKKSHIEDNSDIDIHYSHLNSFENDKPDMLQLIVDEQIKQFFWKNDESTQQTWWIIFSNQLKHQCGQSFYGNNTTTLFKKRHFWNFDKYSDIASYLGLVLYNKIRIHNCQIKEKKNHFKNPKS